MVLSGKLILAWLEEDDAQRALFRVRPLMTGEGAYGQQELDELMDEGYLRVVPDRKEQATFKDRMRELGSLCVIDLRGSVEKTRVNKNYAPHKGEINRTVVYSDVVVRVPDALVYEVMPAVQGLVPLTPRFCLRNGGRIQGPLNAQTREPEGGQMAVAPDSDRLFAVQLPDGREKLFYWPEHADDAVPIPVQPVKEPGKAKPAREEGRAEGTGPAKENKGGREQGKGGSAGRHRNGQERHDGEKVDAAEVTGATEGGQEQAWGKPAAEMAGNSAPEGPQFAAEPADAAASGETPRANDAPQPANGWLEKVSALLQKDKVPVENAEPNATPGKDAADENVAAAPAASAAAPETPRVPEAQQPAASPEPREAPRTAASPRVYIPIHEVVERKRRTRGEQTNAGPEPAEAFQQALETLWRAEGTRAEAVRMLADMPDADALLGRQFRPQMKAAAAAALRRELEDMEAERLRLLMDTDRAKADRDTLFAQALDAARERTERTLSQLREEESALRGRIAGLQSQEQPLLDKRDAMLAELSGGGHAALARPAGEATDFARVAERLSQALQDAGFVMDVPHAGCLLLLLLTCPQVQLDGASAADSVTAAKAVASALGASHVLFPEDERGVLLAQGGDGLRMMITASGGTAPYGYVRLIAGHGAGPEDIWLEYEREPWPCVPLTAREGFFAVTATSYPAVSWDALLRNLPDMPQELPDEAAAVLSALQNACAKAGAPLPLAIRQAAARFVPAAQALTASVVTALEMAMASLILPYARYREVDLTPLLPQLAGFPMSEARLR